MKTSQIYSLNGIRQLIDLNGSSINFDLTFSVTAKDGSDFQAVVVDQNSLDSGSDIEFKEAPGHISGNIKAVDNLHRSYVLILKCDPEKTIECEVTIDKIDLPLNQPQPGTPPPSHDTKLQTKEKFAPPTNGKKNIFSKVKSSFDFKTILKILAVIGIIVFIYFKFFRKTSTKPSSQVVDNGSDELLTLSSDTVPSTPIPELPSEKISASAKSTSSPQLKSPISIEIPKLPSSILLQKPVDISPPSLPPLSSIASEKLTISEPPISSFSIPSVNKDILQKLQNLEIKA